MAFEIDFMPVGDGEKSGDAIAMRFGDTLAQTSANSRSKDGFLSAWELQCCAFRACKMRRVRQIGNAVLVPSARRFCVGALS
jgi:hypothetical protein